MDTIPFPPRVITLILTRKDTTPSRKTEIFLHLEHSIEAKRHIWNVASVNKRDRESDECCALRIAKDIYHTEVIILKLIGELTFCSDDELPFEMGVVVAEIGENHIPYTERGIYDFFHPHTIPHRDIPPWVHQVLPAILRGERILADFNTVGGMCYMKDFTSLLPKRGYTHESKEK